MADLVIRGMEMPQEGNWKTIRIYPDGTCSAPNWQGDCKVLSCIAVPLPEGHGRLIDGDALAYSESVKKKGCAYQEEIFAAPTIVPAEGGGEDG